MSILNPKKTHFSQNIHYINVLLNSFIHILILSFLYSYISMYFFTIVQLIPLNFKSSVEVSPIDINHIEVYPIEA